MKRCICWISLVLLWGGLVEAAPQRPPAIEVSEQQAGKIQVKPPRPEVWYLLPRSTLRFERAQPDLRLSPRIEAAIRSAPFLLDGF